MIIEDEYSDAANACNACTLWAGVRTAIMLQVLPHSAVARARKRR